MYKIKPNGNYNLIIADLDIILCPESDVILTDLEFENSMDIKNILHYLNVQKIDSNEHQENDIIKEEVVDNIPVAFVARSHEVTNNEGFFVKNTESIELNNIESIDKEIKEVRIETVSENVVVDTIDTPVEIVSENIVETENVVTDTIDTLPENVESEISVFKNEEKKVSKSNIEKKSKTKKDKTEIVKSKKISSKKKDNTVQ